MSTFSIVLIIFGAILVIGITVAGTSSLNYKRIMKKYINDNSSIPKSTADLVKGEIKRHNLSVQLVKIAGEVNAHYDYGNKIIALSDDLFPSYSPVAQAVAMHETGHAIQDKSSSKRFKAFKRLNLLSKIFAPIFWIAIVVGIITYFAIDYELLYAYISFGIAGFSFLTTTIFKLITYSMEKEASTIALNILKENEINATDYKIAQKLYRAALTTYLGNIFSPIIKFLDFIIWIIYQTIGRLFR